MGRKAIIAPGVFSVDFATKKNFYFTERSFMQFRFEAFNFLNHPDFADPNTNVSNNAFATITATKAGINMRELQFALKLIFSQSIGPEGGNCGWIVGNNRPKS
jgi:hypothetical protein